MDTITERSTLHIYTNTDTQSGVLSLIGSENEEQGRFVFIQNIFIH